MRKVAVKRVGQTVLVAWLAMMLSGCWGVLIGAGAAATGVAYWKGALEVNLNASTHQVGQAAERALKDLSMHSVTATLTDIDGEVSGKTAEGKTIKISLKRNRDNTTAVSIRVGTFGDQEVSQMVYDRMRNYLPADA